MPDRVEDFVDFITAGLTTYGRVSGANAIPLAKIKDLTVKDGTVTARVLTNQYHLVQIDLESGEYSCTCPDHVARKYMCKHILAVLNVLSDKDFEKFKNAVLEKKPTTGVYYSTGIESVDELLAGGLVSRTFFNLFGPSKVGKTWFSWQVLSLNGGVYIDTEDAVSNQEVVDNYKRIFKKRFGGVKDVKVVSVDTLEDLLGMVGLEAKITKKDKKTEADFMFVADDVRDTVLYRLANKYGAKVIVIDSLSELLKKSIANVEQNFPARSSLVFAFLPRFRSILKALDATALIVNHSSKKRDEAEKTFGGMSMMYLTKYAIHLSYPPVKKKLKPTVRMLTRYYYPTKLQDSVLVELKKDYGFVTYGE